VANAAWAKVGICIGKLYRQRPVALRNNFVKN
jgi:hypothetical protein